ncbi:MAG TPA: OmpA family protein [Stellaceae bacterium]|jgi:outer membrane protein OmpA-like peptidoglycan-associated protein|nr:OmpA family protein [Stellaceae bacterium]
MKRLLLAVVAGAGLILSAGAHAQFNGPELGIQGGYGWGTSSGTVGPGYSFSPDGGMGGAHAGYNFQFGPYVLGLEGDAEGGSISGNGPIGTSVFSVHSNMDFDASIRGKLGFAFNRVLLYGTGGVAFGDVSTDYINGAGVQFANSSGIRVGWTAGGGAEYAVTPNWDLGLEYRYTDLGHEDASALRFTDSNHFTYSMVRLALSYRFAPPPPPPPPMAAPMPAAAPAPPPPQPPRTFLVFFDFDKYNLTPDARRVIEAAAQSYKANGSARLEVSGYTDLAGTQAYNLRLSQRRADAVANYLLRQGVPKNVMDVKWFGKEHPRVPTPDGVREPQNRRVEIVMP